MRTYLYLTFSVVISFIAAGCGDSRQVSVSTGSNQRIINGFEQSAVASPQIVQVTVQYVDGSTGICSGTVIGAGAILTAGHCLLGDISRVTVQSELLAYEALNYAVAPGYFEDVALQAVFNDVGIVLAPGLPLPALGLIASAPVNPELGMTVFGYGSDENGQSGVLKGGGVTVEIVTPNHIFLTSFSGDGANPCFGDSGGPAVQTVSLNDGSSVTGIVGVISSGTVVDCGSGDTTLLTNLQNPALLEFLRTLVPDITIY